MKSILVILTEKRFGLELLKNEKDVYIYTIIISVVFGVNHSKKQLKNSKPILN